jgi:glycosyltransferase involved in cell wall biosynthesis
MNESHPLLSHQIGVVRKLAPHFRKLTVLTGEYSSEIMPPNVNVINMNWVPGSPFRNSSKFLFALLDIFSRDRPDVVFSHMTEVQSLLTIPFTITKKVPHYLWYAHKHKSYALRICRRFVTSIVTSTHGSCPYSGEGVIPIGQAIDYDQFFVPPKEKQRRTELVHIGRSDPSKRIDLMIEAFIFAKTQLPGLRLTLIGSPSSSESQMKLEEIKSTYRRLISDKSIVFLDSVSRDVVPGMLQNFDLFIHAYNGSLDKSVLESITSGVPVATLNNEFRVEFGTWNEDQAANLKEELLSCLVEDPGVLVKKLKLQQEIVKESHSLDIWILRLVTILAS